MEAMQIMKQRVVLLGAKQFNDSVDGKHYDTCKLRVMMPVEQSAREVGYNMTEMQFGTSANYAQFSGLKFPAEVDIYFEMTLKSGRMTTSISKVDVVAPFSEKSGSAKG